MPITYNNHTFHLFTFIRFDCYDLPFSESDLNTLNNQKDHNWYCSSNTYLTLDSYLS